MITLSSEYCECALRAAGYGVYPNANDVVNQGQSYTIRWAGSGSGNLLITLYEGAAEKFTISESIAVGTNRLAYTVPASFTPLTDAKYRVCFKDTATQQPVRWSAWNPSSKLAAGRHTVVSCLTAFSSWRVPRHTPQCQVVKATASSADNPTCEVVYQASQLSQQMSTDGGSSDAELTAALRLGLGLASVRCGWVCSARRAGHRADVLCCGLSVGAGADRR